MKPSSASPVPAATAAVAAVAALLAAAPGVPAQEPSAPPAYAAVFAEGFWAELAGELAAVEAPARLPEVDWPASLDDAGWRAREPWLRWAELVAAERDADAPDPERRAALAWLARRQGRDRDAWLHLDACAGDAAFAAALLPCVALGLEPGRGPGAPFGRGGAPAALPAGWVLEPALPPPSAGALPGRVDVREVTFTGLRIGGAVVALRVAAESDGVQVDLKHLAGEPVDVGLRLPAPDDFLVRVEYFDWEEAEEVGGVHRGRLAPGDPPLSGWARYGPMRTSWPGELPPAGAFAPGSAGVELAVRSADAAPRARGFAAALERLYGWPCPTLVRPRAGAPAGGAGFAPVRIELGDGPDGTRELRALIEMAERYALGAGLAAAR